LSDIKSLCLTGLELEGGWRIKENFTGYEGFFATGYIASHPTKAAKAYVKLCNLDKAKNLPGSFLDNAHNLLKAFKFEKDLLNQCIDKKISVHDNLEIHD